MLLLTLGLVALLHTTTSAPLTTENAPWNLNQNPGTVSPIEYFGKWPNHQYNPSPANWRFPFYTIMVDRFADGDPTNNDIFNTEFEYDVNEVNFRFGGDAKGMRNHLPYLQAMGIKGIYIAGTILENFKWDYHGYNVKDQTLLDRHFGTIDDWRETISEMHKRGMYIILDLTLGTMTDLLGFEGHLNVSTPLQFESEYRVYYKTSEVYQDYTVNNTWDPDCDGNRQYLNRTKGCMDSDFDQYGDIEAFGIHDPWERNLGKFFGVQDRLREWHPRVAAKINNLACLFIQTLDVDGFRIDKATQMSPDFLGDFAVAVRKCAAAVGKKNFFIPGEITGDLEFGAVYTGLGREPQMWIPETPAAVLGALNATSIRGPGLQALDSVCFHYRVYRDMLRFLGLDGDLQPAYSSWPETWSKMMARDDLFNADTRQFDPRHMYGIGNQDVFRWAALENGIKLQNLGALVTTFLLPGIPLIYSGEEQGLHLHDSRAENYVYGRQPLASARAFKLHGCLRQTDSRFFNMPFDQKSRNGCNEDGVAGDHFDPTSPTFLYFSTIHYMRRSYPLLNDGFGLRLITAWTKKEYLPGNQIVPTTFGVWSVVRELLPGQSDILPPLPLNGTAGLPGTLNTSSPVWFVYTNRNSSQTVNYQACASANQEGKIIAPFPPATVLCSIFNSSVTYTLVTTAGVPGQGCLDSVTLPAYGFIGLVPLTAFKPLPRVLVSSTPKHDARILSTGASTSVKLTLLFSADVTCGSLSIIFDSMPGPPKIATETIVCTPIPVIPSPDGIIPSAVWSWSAQLTNVPDGIHKYTVTASGLLTPVSLLFRVGKPDNVLVFDNLGNYSTSLLSYGDSQFKITNLAEGATKMRYSTEYGKVWSTWGSYNQTLSLPSNAFDAIVGKRDTRMHIIVQYYCDILSSATYEVHSEIDITSSKAVLTEESYRLPSLFILGEFNKFGLDGGVSNSMSRYKKDGKWKGGQWRYPIIYKFPTAVQLDVYNDRSIIFGDVDGDGVLDRLPPNAQDVSEMILPVPPAGYLGWMLHIDDVTRNWYLVPFGSSSTGIVVLLLLLLTPLLGASLAVFVFRRQFYAIKTNHRGKEEVERVTKSSIHIQSRTATSTLPFAGSFGKLKNMFMVGDTTAKDLPSQSEVIAKTVLIATLEYEIPDWKIKVRIGGLGVIASLMGKYLEQEVIWVIPKVGDIEYPDGSPMVPIVVTILGRNYTIDLSFHRYKNVRYFLLDAGIFRNQSSKDPYPARMDDLASAIFYSSWNQCIAAILTREKVDLYHCNDFHGSVAPLYLLPKVVPMALSIHNGEFQGLWPLRTEKERKQVCSAFNLKLSLCQKYVQFGNTFNMLHCAASYLRLHQNGVGAAGVSDRYGGRIGHRYPTLVCFTHTLTLVKWGLKVVLGLPNPNPLDVGEDIGYNEAAPTPLPVDERAECKRQAQQWAGLDQKPDADLIVFVGRWSSQKGVDLIADLSFEWLETYPNLQMICIGPVIDLFGKLASIKLEKAMQMFQGRIFSKAEFTLIPKYVHKAADFVFVPSRDEPFGLVAVEFGRYGALGIGSFVGGLGNMPGWWFPIESTELSHLHDQFRSALKKALSTPKDVQDTMRETALRQRFPVEEWLAKTYKLYAMVIKAAVTNSKEEDIFIGGQSMDLYSWNILMYDDTVSINSIGDLSGMPPNWSRTWSTMSTFSGVSLAPIDMKRASSSPLGPAASSSAITPASIGMARSSSSGDSPNILSAFDARKRITERNRISLDHSFPSVTAISTSRLSDVTKDMTDEEHKQNSLKSPVIKSPVEPSAFQRYSTNAHSRKGQPSLAEVTAFQPNTLADLLSAKRKPSIDGTSSFTPSSQASTILKTDMSPSIFRESSMSSSIFSESSSTPSTSRTSFSSSIAYDITFQAVNDFNDYGEDKPFEQFTDEDGEFCEKYKTMLLDISAGNSVKSLSIGKFLSRSENAYFASQLSIRMGKLKSGMSEADANSIRASSTQVRLDILDTPAPEYNGSLTIRQRVALFAQSRYRTWPIYTFFLAIGQLMAATSFQLVLLTGSINVSDVDFYSIGSSFLLGTAFWWTLWRNKPSHIVLTLPFFFYATSFLLIAIPFKSLTNSSISIWLIRLPIWLYSFASASGSLYFVLNFGEEAGVEIVQWVFRASLIQGTNQFWNVALWYWGNSIGSSVDLNKIPIEFRPKEIINWTQIVICSLLSIVFVIVGVIVSLGLPKYYRQIPPTVPALFKTLFRRKLVLWYLGSELLRNFWLSGAYGRNWMYLWTQPVQPWVTALLVVFFFGVLWAVILYGFAKVSKTHSWILPVFAVGLIAPRWAQMWWSTSYIGTGLSWAGDAGPAIGSAVWLWLGVLDAIQAMGLGMMLLQTLTRIHVGVALMISQVLGAVSVIVARSVSDYFTVGEVFPNLMNGGEEDNAYDKPLFWIALITQICIACGYLIWFRKEQLSRP